MKPSHQEKSRLQIQKFVARSLKQSSNWLASTRYYDSNTLFAVLVQAGLERSSVEQCSYVLKEQGIAPSPDTVLGVLRNQFDDIHQDIIGQQVANLLQQQVRQLPQFKKKTALTVIASLDLHDEEYFGQDLYDQSGNRLVFYTPQGKSDKGLRFATLSIVEMKGMKIPLTIGFAINHVNQPREEIVANLLDQINLPLKIELLLLDGGFASKEVLQYLDEEAKIPWITRGKYSSKKEYLGFVNDQWFPYQLKKEYPTAAYLVHAKRPNSKTETVLLLCSRFWTPTPERAKQLYKKRFRIENTYRHARNVKIRTSTRNIQLRWILWAIAHYLELLWEIMRYIHQIQGFDKQLATQKRFILINRQMMESHFVTLQLKP